MSRQQAEYLKEFISLVAHRCAMFLMFLLINGKTYWPTVISDFDKVALVTVNYHNRCNEVEADQHALKQLLIENITVVDPVQSDFKLEGSTSRELTVLNPLKTLYQKATAYVSEYGFITAFVSVFAFWLPFVWVVFTVFLAFAGILNKILDLIKFCFKLFFNFIKKMLRSFFERFSQQ